MDFTYTKQEEEFRYELRTWLEGNLPEGWLEGKRELPQENELYKEFLVNWQKTLYDGGWAAITWPKKYGGREATLMEEIIYQQEMVRVNAPSPINYIGIHMVGPTLMDIGTEEQKQKYIRNILTGEQIWCQGYSEPSAGSDLTALQTSAVKEGDRWIINGQKVWTSYAHLADRCFLLARTSFNPEKKHKGITVFLLDMKQPGVETQPIVQINGSKHFNEVFLSDAIAYDSDIVGEVDNGWRVLIALMLHERSGIGAQVFSLERQFNEIIKMTKEYKVNGEPILKDPFVRKQMSSFYAKFRGSLLNYYRNLTNTIKSGKPGPETSMDKLIVSELTKEINGFVMSIRGHRGILLETDEAPWVESYLGSFGSTIGGGTSEVQRNTIGERILGLPKDMGR